METLNNNQQTTGLKIFNNSEIGARIRATTERNETWFVAQDICDILNLKNPRKAIQWRTRQTLWSRPCRC